MCARERDGVPFELGTSGYTDDHVFVLYDRATESLWTPRTDATLDAVAGPRAGESLAILAEPEPVPLSAWLAAHPGSTVLLPSAEDAVTIALHFGRPVLGVELAESDFGVGVAAVAAGGPAAAAGVEPGDVIVWLDDRSIGGRDDLGAELDEHVAGDLVLLVVVRGEDELELEVTLGERP